MSVSALAVDVHALVVTALRGLFFPLPAGAGFRPPWLFPRVVSRIDDDATATTSSPSIVRSRPRVRSHRASRPSRDDA